MDKKLSGKFVLRLPTQLHGTLKILAAQKGVSLNELCLRAMESYIHGMRLGEERNTKEQPHWLNTIQEMLAESLIGVILFGSAARGEDHSASDIDLLLVVASNLPLTRRLYALWDEHISGEQYSPHFVHLPETVDAAGSIWFETAVDGIILYEVGRSISRFLSRIRRKIAAGGLERKTAYGHPYWVKREEDTSDVQ